MAVVVQTAQFFLFFLEVIDDVMDDIIQRDQIEAFLKVKSKVVFAYDLV